MNTCVNTCGVEERAANREYITNKAVIAFPMPEKRPSTKNFKSYPLMNNGCFTWNKPIRRLCFLRAGDMGLAKEEYHFAQQFFVEGDDIKHLYQVLHEHFAGRRVGQPTQTWFDDAEQPEPKITVKKTDPESTSHKPIRTEKPHEQFPDIEL